LAGKLEPGMEVCMSNKTKDRIGLILGIVAVLIFAWMFFSFLDMNAHNLTDHDYAPWNFFKLFIKWRFG
jgi:hypothetical protein